MHSLRTPYKPLREPNSVGILLLELGTAPYLQNLHTITLCIVTLITHLSSHNSNSRTSRILLWEFPP